VNRTASHASCDALSAHPHATGREDSTGQSLVEFALVVPVLLLLLLVGVDFGRVYLGWVNLQQMARVAAGFASENASAWQAPGNSAVRVEYQDRIANDATQINCDLPKDGAGKVHVPDPAFAAGFDLGDPILVEIPCNFHLVTPIIGNIIGDVIPVTASYTYPVKEGAVAEVPGGGGPVVIPPIADFVGKPRSGFGKTAAEYGTLDVTFNDLSKNAPTSWQWSFGNGAGTAFTKGPHTIHYECDQLPGETCTYTVRLTVGSPGGFDTMTKTDYITVTVPPDTGPVAEFTATPNAGVNPLGVAFAFVDKRAGTVSYSSYEWDFTGDGTWDSTGAMTSHTYNAPGAYTVSLRVTEQGTGVTNVQTKTEYVVVDKKTCVVPDFANHRKNEAQGIWGAAGFTTSVQFGGGNGNFVIHSQTLTGGTIDPQPLGCASVVRVGP
jgi:PKD repeat protein